MKAPALRTLSLTLVFTVAIGVWLRHRVVTAAPAGVAVTAGVDRGKALPNVTDGFAGAAPDLGAIELGQTAPHYGPRD